ncbi:hypothetical protein DKP78_14735 [Enterococcus faecium]|nr:hypothetical protein DKP78_14735 [Enterococcus faecium]
MPERTQKIQGYKTKLKWSPHTLETTWLRDHQWWFWSQNLFFFLFFWCQHRWKLKSENELEGGLQMEEK